MLFRSHRGEPPAPTPFDEVLSRESLNYSPWVKQRIKLLGIKGRKITTWLPPFIEARQLPPNERPWN